MNLLKESVIILVNQVKDGLIMTKINVILGSVREPSMGHRLFTYLENHQDELEAKNGVAINFIKIGDYKLAPYNEPFPPMATPDYVNTLDGNQKKWVEDVSDADGMLLLAPEYDYSIPGALKTALDYLAQGVNDKPVQVISYSMGKVGGLLGTMALLPVFQVLNMITLSHNMQLANIQNVFTADGELNPDLSDKEKTYYTDRIDGVVKNLAHYAKLLK
ncbi:NADPH-dependent FMN reductase [Fructilactobacillus sp. Tb1]|uniref:NADPH-dependent FMN reductase n=1 Tax=Fructilactobacillus sp. Tb1 TaxID=3422304 RepID=UPI003D2C27C7